MKRAAIYVRVSTDLQAEKGYGSSSQLEGCQHYAQSNGFTIVEEVIDSCSGTVPIKQRREGEKLYELVDGGLVDAVILYTHDRTARDELVLEYLLFKAYLYEHGVELHFSDAGLDPHTMTGDIIGYIKAQVASDELKKIRERSMRGRQAKAKAGKWVGGHPTPYGYNKVGLKRDTKLEINEEEAAIVRRIFDMYTGRSEKRYTMLEIARVLTNEGVRLPGRGMGFGKAWYQTTIKNIIDRRAYIGEFIYSGIVIKLPELALVDLEVFEQAQKQREINIMNARRNKKYNYLLSGRLKCACGRVMSGANRGRFANSEDAWYYRCNSMVYPQTRTCFEPHLRVDKADRLVWDWVSGLLLDEDRLERGIRAMSNKREDELKPKKERLELVNELLEKADRKIRKLLNAFGDEIDETISETLEAEIKSLSGYKKSMTQEKALLEAEINQRVISEEQAQSIKEQAAVIRRRLSVNPSFEHKRELLDILDVRVRLRVEGNKRVLAVSCDLTPTLEAIEYSSC